MKPDLLARSFRRRREQGQKFLVDFAQGGVVFQPGPIDFGKSLQNRGIRGQFFPLLDKRANDIDTHCNGTVASQDVRRLKSAVFGERPWPVFPMLTSSEL